MRRAGSRGGPGGAIRLSEARWRVSAQEWSYLINHTRYSSMDNLLRPTNAPASAEAAVAPAPHRRELHTPMPSAATTDRRQTIFLIVLFCVALAAHFHFATRNWQYRFMMGHEFRQTQTALIAHYIDKENNFSLDYSVPLLGKPWILPLEFPLYEWGVVGLSRATGWPQFEAARTISLASFYLTLPALFLLLGQLGLAGPRRLFALACVLACPVYLFYSRAVLIDPTALMFSVWFLAAFTRMLAGRSWRWLPVVIVCGTLAGLVKSLVWFVWVIPAMAYGAWRLWRDWRSDGIKGALGTLVWGVGSVALPFAAAIWWARHTDALKVHHSSAHIFTSANLGIGNYGTFSLAARLSAETWRNLFDGWRQSLLPPWAFAAIILPGLVFLRGWRLRIAGAAACFLAAQLSIPLAYALQDYYFYAANAFAAVAVAFVFLGLLDTKLPRLLTFPLLLLPLGALHATYHATYYPMAQVKSFGGSGLTETLKAYTPPGSVIIVAGADWSAIIPYYAERKALMIRNGLENDVAYLDRAFADLADEEISALVLVGDQRNNHALAERAARAFNLDTAPTYSHTTADVYIGNLYRELTLRRVKGNHGYEGISTRADGAGSSAAEEPFRQLPPPAARAVFGDVTQPVPTACRIAFGFDAWVIDGVRCLSLHADSDLIVPVPTGAHHIVWHYGILRGAYERDGDTTNGVEFIIEGETPDGTRRELFRRLLDPAATPGDRDTQILDLPFVPRTDEHLYFRTRSNGSAAFDWAFFSRLLVE